jgi:hypothetical protein
MEGMKIFRRSIAVNVGLLAAALVLASGTEALAQQRNRNPAAAAPPAALNRLPRALQGEVADLPPNWIEQLQEMTPAQQQRFLNNNLRFRSLPAQQQALIRRRLRAWNSLPLNQRQALLLRQQIWEQLPLEQRRQVRESLLPRWQNLPELSRQVILGKLRELRGLDGAQRNAKLSDESFLGTMNAEERQMLRDLSSLGVEQAG